MAIVMPSPQAAGAKWASVTPTRQQYYQAGVQGAGQRWQQGVDSSEQNWSMGVQQAMAENRYTLGVSGKASKYSQKASTIGAPRWGTGVASAEPAYEAGVTRIFQALSSLTLPPRGPTGSPQNLARVQAVVDAERAAR